MDTFAISIISGTVLVMTGVIAFAFRGQNRPKSEPVSVKDIEAIRIKIDRLSEKVKGSELTVEAAVDTITQLTRRWHKRERDEIRVVQKNNGDGKILNTNDPLEMLRRKVAMRQ